MTKVVCRYGEYGYSVTASGHAGTSTSCTAVSAILGALAGWCSNSGGTCLLDKGKAVILIPAGERAEAVMDMTTIGLLQVQKAAPGDLEIEICDEEITVRNPVPGQ